MHLFSRKERDVATLRSLIVKSGEAFNASDPAAIQSSYARDVILSYPGVPDDYETLARASGSLGRREAPATRWRSSRPPTVRTLARVLSSSTLSDSR